jgi:predicted metal-dependent hydrolase
VEELRRIETAFGPAEVLIRRSTRRKKTLSARYEGDRLVVLAPSRASARELPIIVGLAERVMARRAATEVNDDGGRGQRTDAWLTERAQRLIDACFPGLEPPASIRWVTNQNTRWGSASIRARTIRLSHHVAAMPEWVIDSVIVHELAHLIEPNHGPRFHELTRRYTRTADAHHFLAGVEHGRRQAERDAQA